MASSDNGTGSSLTKWHIVFGLGAAGVIGFGYWYYKTNKTKVLKDLGDAISIDDTIESGNEPSTKSLFDVAQDFKNEGNDFFKKGKYDEAIQYYNKAIDACPTEKSIELATYYQNRAAAYEKLRKWSAVITDCTKAIELNAKYEKALFRRAKAEENIKDWENCLDDITCVCILQQFKNETSLLMTDRVLNELGKQRALEKMKNRKPVIPSKNFIKTYFSSFSEDIVHKKLMETDEILGQGDLKGFLKAKLAFATDKFDEVIPACSEEINSSESESPYIFEALSLRASFYFFTGFFDLAVDDLTTIINSKDANVKIKVNSLIKRASIYMQTEKLSECLKDFEVAAELGSDISDVYHHRGQVKLLMNKAAEAMEDFKKAVELSPNFPVAYVQKCYSDYRHASQTQDEVKLMKSFADFRKGMEKFPNCAETYVLFAQVLSEQQKFEEAVELYNKALEVDPKNASVYVHKGLLYIQWKSDLNEAVELIKEAIRVDEKCEFAYETLGTVEVQRCNWAVAIELFNKAIEMARSEMEMVHLFSLRDAAASQLKVTTRLGIESHFTNNTI